MSYHVYTVTDPSREIVPRPSELVLTFSPGMAKPYQVFRAPKSRPFRMPLGTEVYVMPGEFPAAWRTERLELPNYSAKAEIATTRGVNPSHLYDVGDYGAPLPRNEREFDQLAETEFQHALPQLHDFVESKVGTLSTIDDWILLVVSAINPAQNPTGDFKLEQQLEQLRIIVGRQTVHHFEVGTFGNGMFHFAGRATLTMDAAKMLASVERLVAAAKQVREIQRKERREDRLDIRQERMDEFEIEKGREQLAQGWGQINMKGIRAFVKARGMAPYGNEIDQFARLIMGLASGSSGRSYSDNYRQFVGEIRDHQEDATSTVRDPEPDRLDFH